MNTKINDNKHNNKRVNNPNVMYAYIGIHDLKAWQLIN